MVFYSADAVVCALSNVYFPMSKVNSISKKTTSTSSSIERDLYSIRERVIGEFIPKCPKGKYFNLEQRIPLIPPEHSWKIDDVWWLFQRVDDANTLHFKKRTFHPKYFKVTEKTHEYIINNMKTVWNIAAEICKKNKIYLGNFRTSFLELVDVDGEEKKASDEDLLYIIVSTIRDDKNPLSKTFSDILYRTEIAYKTWEYFPHTRITKLGGGGG